MANITEDESNHLLVSPEIPDSQSDDQQSSGVAVLEPEEQRVEPLEQSGSVENISEPVILPTPKQHSALPQPPQKLLSRFEDFMVPALVLFLLGCALAFALPNLAFAYWQIGVPLLVILLGIVIYGVNKPDSRWVIRLDAWVMVLILGAMYYHYRQFIPGPSDISKLAPRAQVKVIGTVTGTLPNNRLVLAVSKAGRDPVTGQVILYLPKNHENQLIEVGTRLLVNGELSIPYTSNLPGVFNYQEYLRSQHITALLKYPSRMIAYETSNQLQFLMQRWADALKQRVSDTFTHALPSPQAEVLGGIVLGDKAIPVDAATKQAFIQTGLIHVLAASGMNVGIIAMAVLWLLRRIRAPRSIQFGVSMLAVAFYSLLTGLPPSIQRAAAMLELALFLKMLNKELSPLFLLCVASTLLVLISPDNIASVGFQFSVLTTFGLLSMVPPLQDFLGYYITRWLAGLILVPLVAQLWIWPLSVAYFNQFPIHSVPLNIAALGLVAPLTIIGFVAGLASMVFTPLGALLCGLARPCLDGLLWLVHGGNSLTWAQWSLPSPEPWMIAGLYLCLFVFLALIYRFKKWSIERKALLGLLFIALLLGGLCLENSQAQHESRLEWLPISETKQAVLLQPAHQQGLLLIAPQHLRYYEARTLGDYLKHRHIDRLSAVLLLPPTEAQSGRFGSLKQAFRQTAIDSLIVSEEFPMGTLPNVKQQVAFPTTGAQLQLGNLHLEGLLNQLAIFSGKYCLLGLKQVPEAAPESVAPVANIDLAFLDRCAVQASFGDDGTKLNSQPSLTPGQYHQWVQEGPRLTLF